MYYSSVNIFHHYNNFHLQIIVFQFLMDLPYHRDCLYLKINKGLILNLFKDKKPCFLSVTLVFELGASPIHRLQPSAASEILYSTSIL